MQVNVEEIINYHQHKIRVRDMSILVHVYSGGKTMEDQPITFEEAMYLVENQDTFYQDEDNFLGFTAPEDQDAVLQFIREEDDKWIVDIPVVNDDIYKGSFNSITSHSKVVAIISNFFMKEANVRQSIVHQNYELLKKEMASRWGIDLYFIETE